MLNAIIYATTYYRRVVISGTTAYSNTVQITVTSSGSSVTSVNGLTGAINLGLSSSVSGTNRTIGITNGSATTINVADNDNSSTNEIQSLGLSGNTLSISSGNSVTITTATYPGAGIPVSTGSAWTTSIPNNSANWNTAYGWGNHAGLYRPIIYVPIWSEIASKPSTVSGFGITNAMTTSHAANSITSTNISVWNAKQSAITHTTTGTSGAATFNGTTLNIPQYSAGSWSTSSNNYTSGGLSIGSSTAPASGLYVNERVGIRVPFPSASLHIREGILLMNGNSNLGEGDARITIDTELSTAHDYIECKDNNGVEFKVDWEGKVNCGGVYINKTPEWNSGNLIVDNLVRIGCTEVNDPSVKLLVNGHIKATSNLIVDNVVRIGCTDVTSEPNTLLYVNGHVKANEITVQSSMCSDFVFEEDYKLPSLSEVEKFVKANKHLPEIPSMHEFKEKGQNLAEMDDLLLRKIEELTLYIIEQNKKIEALEQKLNY